MNRRNRRHTWRRHVLRDAGAAKRLLDEAMEYALGGGDAEALAYLQAAQQVAREACAAIPRRGELQGVARAALEAAARLLDDPIAELRDRQARRMMASAAAKAREGFEVDLRLDRAIRERAYHEALRRLRED